MTKVRVLFLLWVTCSLLGIDCAPQLPMMPGEMPSVPPRGGMALSNILRMFGLNFDFNAGVNGGARLADGNGGGPGFNIGFGGNGGVSLGR
ncbi:hypothetical protein HNY73_008310 [Argiope bruennichi]|uniref:Glycine-rich protein n=1 Tax=Argiope bruennichi TaxID=94029 RepID=A0A8T0F6Y7_ARGBR|nr:hypothetical protein HNY73_008310 [Argiope bruennichi]